MSVSFVDQTIRDGQQSLWGMRMSGAMMLPALPHLDAAGYKTIDFTGGAMFQVMVRNMLHDPWAVVRDVTGRVATPMRAAIRGDGILMGPAPDALVDLWIERLVANGIRSFWVFDVLFHEQRVERIVRKAKQLGAEVVGAVMFTESPVHTDEYYAQKTAVLATLPIDGIYLEDTAGVLTPERARTLIPAVQAAAGLPLEAHFHNTTGLAPLCYVEALNAGVRTIHTAVPPMADSGSLPSIVDMLKLVGQLGLETTLNSAHIDPVRSHFTYVGQREGFELGGPTPYDLDVYKHQIPGGMMGTLKAQLAEVGLLDRLDEILEETAVVRRELGYPGMATPLSQFAGIQATLNLLTRERYSSVPLEVIRYINGYYGEPVGPLDDYVVDKVSSMPLANSPKGRDIEQPSLADLRKVHGNVSDDELILRATMSGSEVDAMRAAPPEGDYPASAAKIVRRLVGRLNTGPIRCSDDSLPATLGQVTAVRERTEGNTL